MQSLKKIDMFMCFKFMIVFIYIERQILHIRIKITNSKCDFEIKTKLLCLWVASLCSCLCVVYGELLLVKFDIIHSNYNLKINTNVLCLFVASLCFFCSTRETLLIKINTNNVEIKIKLLCLSVASLCFSLIHVEFYL